MLNPAFEAFHRIAEDLTGLELSHIWQGHGSSLFLEFGALSQRLRHDGSLGNPIGEISVGLEYAWRIELDNRVLCGSDGDPRLWAEAWPRLIGKRAVKVETFGDIPELRVTLDNQGRLFSFSLDEDGPKWALTDNRHSPGMWVFWRESALYTENVA
jgi:hypothetical protein